MKGFVILEDNESKGLVRIAFREVARGSRAQKRALLGHNVERAVEFLRAVSDMPRFLAENVVRWRAKHGMVMVRSWSAGDDE